MSSSSGSPAASSMGPRRGGAGPARGDVELLGVAGSLLDGDAAAGVVGHASTVPVRSAATPGSPRGSSTEERTPMRQLTPLDAQFLAVESPRTYGHVSSFAVYDPSTAPGGEIG